MNLLLNSIGTTSKYKDKKLVNPFIQLIPTIGREIRTMIHLIVALLFLSHLSPLFSGVHAGESGAPTAYELLQSYDFPVGLLPKGVTGYDLDEHTGKFNAYLNGSCSFALEGSYQLSYGSKISGRITRGKITKLSGISVKVLIMWLNIVEVRRNGENLEFSVGIASADFSIDNFLICPQCGCGLDCNSLPDEIRTNPSVSSI
ncbi:hypothetical protein M9H77_01686 [Catharanthus roseus]|uniref:Uncharacterized protein n=1 Tax=Catharanthus roseus TaxID=4058 RepID=A0ACC0C6M7_CATRO|nr:hypothetical protein M9H77_01686 [Catharanthus roseus]